VARAGIDPLSRTMAIAFVLFGVLWLAAAVALASGRARYPTVVLAVATLWYAPVGTVLAAIVAFIALRARGSRGLRSGS
jgi:hypothetical protein